MTSHKHSGRLWSATAVPVEVAAYYVVSETLTNAAKHANASSVSVDVDIDDGILRVGVRDDGIGGAAFERAGSGVAKRARPALDVDGSSAAGGRRPRSRSLVLSAAG